MRVFIRRDAEVMGLRRMSNIYLTAGFEGLCLSWCVDPYIMGRAASLRTKMIEHVSAMGSQTPMVLPSYPVLEQLLDRCHL